MVKKRKHIRRSKGQQKESRPWYDLPVDILNLICSLLPIVEQIRFRSVCKNWQLVEPPHFERNVPWLLCHFRGDYGPNSSFHIPSPNQTHIVSDNVGIEYLKYKDAKICASKHGWLLLQQSSSKELLLQYSNNKEAFFFNPFSTEVIKLPNMDITFNRRATFSSPPTSPDCLCFAVHSSKSLDRIRISMCSPGDLQWRTTTVVGFNKSILDVVYSNGRFYCVFTGGVLGAFFVEDCSWSMLTSTKCKHKKFLSWSRLKLIEDCNGDMLLVSYTDNYYVFKFDMSDLVWKDLHNLGNQAIFLGCTSFAIETEGKTSALAGRIYYHRHYYSQFNYYSLHTDEYYICDDFYPWVVPDIKKKVWIEPPSF